MTWQRHTLPVRRLRYRRRVRGTALFNYWRESIPEKINSWRNASFLACDAEMSSLDPESGELLSLGWVTIERGGIPLRSGEHHLLQHRNPVGESATIHRLRDCEFEQALAPAEAMERFLIAAAGRIVVFHNADMDMAFLNRASRALYGAPLLLPYTDTLRLEQRKLLRRSIAIKPGDLRLQACRARYKLPPYPAHNALVDALATAELFLAQMESGSAL